MSDDAVPLVITVATRKGGSGKSTLVRLLAGELASRGSSVGLIDGDRQGTLSNWFEKVKANGRMPSDIDLVKVVSMEDVRSALARFAGKDAVLIDSPGELNMVAVSVAMSSDIVLLPVRSQQDDTDAGLETFQRLQETKSQTGSEAIIRFVFNDIQMLDTKSKGFERACRSLESAGGSWLTTLIASRQMFKEMNDGAGTLYTMPFVSEETIGKARGNVRVLVDEIGALLEGAQ